MCSFRPVSEGLEVVHPGEASKQTTRGLESLEEKIERLLEEDWKAWSFFLISLDNDDHG
jgi:hypothetical protein